MEKKTIKFLYAALNILTRTLLLIDRIQHSIVFINFLVQLYIHFCEYGRFLFYGFFSFYIHGIKTM